MSKDCINNGLEVLVFRGSMGSMSDSLAINPDIPFFIFFFFQAEDGIRDIGVTGVQTCALPISCIFEPGRL